MTGIAAPLERANSDVTCCDTNSKDDESDETGDDATQLVGTDVTLNDRLNRLCNRYIENGLRIKRQVFVHLRDFRDQLRRVFRWGKSSLAHLHNFLDQSLADELIFTIGGRMSRILLTLKTLEKASNDVELNFIQKQSSVLGHCNTTTPTAVSLEVTDPHVERNKRNIRCGIGRGKQRLRGLWI